MINGKKIRSIIYSEPTDQFEKPPLKEVKASFKYYKCTLERVWNEYYFGRALIVTLKGMIPDVVRNLAEWIFYVISETIFVLSQGKRRKADLGTYTLEKILLMRLDHIGDLLMTTPAIRALRHHFPNAKIDVMVGSWAADVLKNNPYIDSILIYNLKWYNRGKRNFLQTLQNVKIRLKILLEQYDLVINFRGDAESLLLTYLTGAPYRIATICDGVEAFQKKIWLTHGISDEDKTHYVDLNLKLLKILGIYEKDRSVDMFVNREDEIIIEDLIKTEESDKTVPIIAICPGSGWLTKNWPLENYAALTDWLMEEFQAKVIIVGGRGEKMIVDSMRQIMKSTPIDAVGKTTLQQVAAILKFVDLFIGNDGGVTHIAGAMKTPVICLWGGGLYEKYRPLGRYTKVIRSSFGCPILASCEHFVYGKKMNCFSNLCMKSITLQTVKEAAIEVLCDFRLAKARM